MKREGLTAEYVINMTRCVLIHLIFDLGAFYGHKKFGHSLIVRRENYLPSFPYVPKYNFAKY